MTKKIPIYGNITRPSNPEEGLSELQKGAIEWTKGTITIEYSSDEFTSLCPSTGQPDFNTISIKYEPSKLYIESKCMKFYLWSFREFGIHCEHLADKIATDIFNALQCRKIVVEVQQKPRGGIGLKCIKELKLNKL